MPDSRGWMMEGTREIRKSEPCSVVIFGASGDLTKRKLMPALWNLYCEGNLPEQFAVVGVARTEMSHEEFRQETREAVAANSRFPNADPEALRRFTEGVFYLP